MAEDLASTPEKPPYRKWVGILLSFFLAGSAQFLSGDRAKGLRWYFTLLAGCLLGEFIFTVSGTMPYLLGLLISLACLILWFIMLKQSYRPVPRFGFIGWLKFIAVVIVNNLVVGAIDNQFLTPFNFTSRSMEPTIYCIHGHYLPPDSYDRPSFIDLIVLGSKYYEVRAVSHGILSSTHDRIKANFKSYRV